MCNSICLFNSINSKRFLNYSKILNITIILFNSLILLITILCFISCNLDLIIITGYISYINNIIFCLIMISIIMLIIFYTYKKNVINEKKQAIIILSAMCLCISMVKYFTTLTILRKVKNRYKMIKKFEYPDPKSYKDAYNQTKVLLIYLLMIFILYFFNLILWLFYIILIFSLRINIINNERNNNIYNRNNLSYLSTKTDLGENNREIIINNLNEENNYYYFSKNIIKEVEKDFEDKEIQTNIKGIVK